MPPQPAPEPSISPVPPAAIGELQSQLQDTQSSLAGYANKFRILDSLISDHDDDDARSVAIVVPQELERVDEEDEEATAEHEDRRRSSREVGRPRTPKPSLVEFNDDDITDRSQGLTSQKTLSTASKPSTHTGTLSISLGSTGLRPEHYPASRTQGHRTSTPVKIDLIVWRTRDIVVEWQLLAFGIDVSLSTTIILSNNNSR